MNQVEDVLEQGKQHHLAGRLDPAKELFLSVLQSEPYHPEALHRLGLIAAQQGDNQQAVAYLKSAAAADKGRADVFADLGVVYRMLGDTKRAETHLKRATSLKPDHPPFHYNLGLALSDLGQLDEAAKAYRAAIELSPDYAVAHNNLGNILKRQNKLTEALTAYQDAVAADADFAPAHKNLADAYETLGDADKAAGAYTTAIHLRPDAGTRIREALLLPTIPDSADQIEGYRLKLSSRLEDLSAETLVLENPLQQVGATNFLLAYHGLDDCRIQSHLADLYLNACPQLGFEAAHCGDWMAGLEGGKIRIGFISSFFFDHTIARLNRGLITGLPKDRFEVIVYSLADIQDGTGRELAEAADSFVHLSKNLETARQRIASDELDILYYTDVGMEPITYFLAFSRLAPIQCATWGHPVTTGIPNMDYFISSRLTEPEDAGQAYRERLVELDGFSTSVADPAPGRNGVSAVRASGGGRILCPQSLFKFHPDFDPLLGALLEKCPDAELILLDGSQATWSAKLKERLSRNLPAVSDRISFAPRSDRAGFLELMASADVILDTPHFTGGMTTYEALATGTPVVTLPGDFMRGRLTLGLYQQMGVTDCVASSAKDYVDIAARLVLDRSFNAEIQRSILDTSPKIFGNRKAVDQHARFFEKAMFGNDD